MAKGALAIGVGAALLLGGGGTLAVWNQTQAANAGQIQAGDLELTTQPGVWKNAYGTVVDLVPNNGIEDYKVVPGDVLTYSQEMNVKLTGDLMQAKLSIQNLPKSEFALQNVSIENVVVRDSAGKDLKDAILKPANSGTVTASAKFTFKQDTDLRANVNAVADFAAVSYKLDQQVLPTPTASATPGK
ncbi:alternate-type signal peptide domain-containing protein [Arthrobacter sunyaminii]|uniref:Alternate-type signal peptide domain-containing protein n=1 Tax=Arthrobacter sunyaminii TaxID=2816859 RepID=A0A975S7E5_9MICC|nr:alternate-type signal peptide domain-containing protein [Arthrobacter sunyaminii]MBO0908172.1 alternate-type signal peptide domain-containing protein [Arthrobacter sunyaminii]QWQ37180.1 alternate-type signal peptide domain-containing protein [Arthrobacter sunyaminii]